MNMLAGDASLLTKAQAEQALRAARQALESAGMAWTKERSFMNSVCNQFLEFENVVRATDFQNLTPAQSRALRWSLSHTMPRKVGRMVRHLVRGKEYDAANVKLPVKVFAKVRQAQAVTGTAAAITRAMKEAQTTAIPAGKQKLALSETPPAAPAEPHVAFPKLPAVSGMVDQAVRLLRERWERAYAMKSLTTEDRFMVEQIATAYLPDSWRMFEDVRGLSPETVQEGEDLLLKQLRHLTARLDGLQNREAASALQSLRAQTDFIEQTSPKSADSHLDL